MMRNQAPPSPLYRTLEIVLIITACLLLSGNGNKIVGLYNRVQDTEMNQSHGNQSKVTPKPKRPKRPRTERRVKNVKSKPCK